MISKEKGITLVTLVVTVMVLLILAGVTIGAIINGDILGGAKKTTFQNELRSFQEKISLFQLKKEELTGKEFNIGSLNADATSLIYENITENEAKEGTIYNIIPDIADKYKNKISIENGNLVLEISDEREREWAQEIGVQVK